MSVLFAFLHHVAAFVLFATLVVELVLIRGELSVWSARKLKRADFIYGIAAGAIIVIGLVRVNYFEKGPAYYSHSAPFIAKMTLFIIAGLLSIYPTIVFLKWNKVLKLEQVPELAPGKRRLISMLIHAELTCIVLMLLAAALMARGIGFFG